MIWRYLAAAVLSVAVLYGWQMWLASSQPRPADRPEAVPVAGPDDGSSDAGVAADAATGIGPAPAATDGATAANGEAAAATAAAAAAAAGAGPASAGVAAATTVGGVSIDWDAGGRGIAALRVASGSDATPREVIAPAAGFEDAPRALELSVELLAEGGAGPGDSTPATVGDWRDAPGAVRGWSHVAVVPAAGAGRADGTSSTGLTLSRDVRVLESASAIGRTLRVAVGFRNDSADPIRFRYRLQGPNGLRGAVSGDDLFVARGARGDNGTSGGAALGVATRTAVTLTGAPWRVAGSPVWIACGNADLLAVLWSNRAVDGASTPFASAVLEARRAPAGVDASTQVVWCGGAVDSAIVSVAPGQRHVEEFLLHIGPRDPKSLAADVPDAGKLRLARASHFDVDFDDKFRLTIDSGMGSLVGAYLLEYFEEDASVEPRVPYRILLEPRDGEGFLTLARTGQGGDGASGTPGAGWRGPWKLTQGTRPDGRFEVTLERTVGEVRVRKRISSSVAADFAGSRVSDELFALAEGRILTVRLEFEHVGREGAEDFLYYFYGPGAIASSSRRMTGKDIQFGVGVHTDAGHIVTQVLGTPADGEPFRRGAPIAWLAVVNSYFTALMFPVADRAVDTALAEALPYPSDDPKFSSFETVRTWIEGQERLLAGAPAEEITFGVYLGPRSSGFLARGDALELEGVNDYGWFSGLVHFFIWLLGALGSLSSGAWRWGWAIILLTVLVKLCLHPINRKSQRSMMRFQKKMQKIQPQMKRLQEQFKGDRTRYSQEVQKLWRAHGVNPGQGMMSCLIMFLQLPIWFSLYYSLEYAIDLRQAPFAYMHDLTLPDQLFPLGFTLPFLGAHFNLLPVLYVILTLVNQRLQPRPTDPQMQSQYKMMTFMMVFFGFIFYGFPAGFMLYIMTSSALGIVESKLIKAQLAKEDGAMPESPVEVITSAPATVSPGRASAAAKEGRGRPERGLGNGVAKGRRNKRR